LRIRALGTDPINNILRAHVHPLNINVRVRLLELGLVINQEIAAVRGIHNQLCSAVAPTAPGGEERCTSGSQQSMALQWDSSHESQTTTAPPPSPTCAARATFAASSFLPRAYRATGVRRRPPPGAGTATTLSTMRFCSTS